MRTSRVFWCVCLPIVLVACAADEGGKTGENPGADSSNIVHSSPGEAGFSADALTAAVDIVRQAVDEGKITGVQVLIARHGKVVVHEAFGLRDIEQSLPLEKDTLIRMASNTKTFVATGILMLAEDGLLDISAPVSEYLPGFSEGLSASLTVKDLLRHTSGFEYTYTNYVGEVTMSSDEFPDAPSLIVEAIKIGRAGPVVEPGSQCQYTNWGYTVLGGILEQVSGKKLDVFLNEGLYGPLGMTDTSHDLFGVDPMRLSLSYQMSDDGWQVLPPETPPFARSTGGLVSTAWDYAKFAQLFLDEGSFGTSEILKPETAREATSVQVECPHLYVGPDRMGELGILGPWNYQRDRRNLGLDIGYGLGWAVSANGSFGHSGFRGTYALIDPNEELILLLFAQSRVGGTPGQQFIDAVYAAIVE